MGWLRLLLLAGCIGAVAVSAAAAPWEARLVQGNHSWIMHLGTHPVWRPPAAPDYQAFRQHFEESRAFPPPDGEWAIRASYDPAGVALGAVVCCWPVALICGLLYLAARGPRRDVVLHCALHVAAGLSVAVAACVAVWCVVGGWGPPAVGCFGVLGLVGGVISGVASFSKGTPNQALQPTGPAQGGRPGG